MDATEHVPAAGVSQRNRGATDQMAGYSRAALSRLALSQAAAFLADTAGSMVPTQYDDPRELIATAGRALAEARELLERAVVHARQSRTSWETIGAALGDITRQTAQARYAQAVTDWELGLLYPYGPADDDEGMVLPYIPTAAAHPAQEGPYLDRWARDYRHHTGRPDDDEHPVTGHLPTLTTVEEINQVLAAIDDAVHRHLTGEDLARLHDRKAALQERIAAEAGDPGAAELAAASRARAAQLRSDAR